MSLFEGRKRRPGDRNDGFRIRNLDPMGRLLISHKRSFLFLVKHSAF